VVGLLFTCHGLSSIFGIMGGNMGHGDTIPAGTWPGWWVALIQLVAGVLVLVGLWIRGAALLASGSITFAYFTVHQEKAFFPSRTAGRLRRCSAGRSCSSCFSAPANGPLTDCSIAAGASPHRPHWSPK
jgi:putative oxidoreductase